MRSASEPGEEPSPYIGHDVCMQGIMHKQGSTIIDTGDTVDVQYILHALVHT